MKDKLLRQLLFGNYEELGKRGSRGYTLTFPAKEEGDIERKIHYAGDDGILLYLIKKIEKLEKQKSGNKSNN